MRYISYTEYFIYSLNLNVGDNGYIGQPCINVNEDLTVV